MQGPWRSICEPSDFPDQKINRCLYPGESLGYGHFLYKDTRLAVRNEIEVMSLEANKENAIAFYKTAYEGNPKKAIAL